MNLLIKPLHPDFTTPRYETTGAAGFDLVPDNHAFAKLTAQKMRAVADIIDPETKD